jgi:histidinol-phosphatase (PHP family)
MRLSNTHTHSRFCDGRGELEDYVRAAVRKGFRSLGFSAHAPVPFASDWHMAAGDLPGYVAEVRRLQRAYGDRLDVLLGLEVDYVPGVLSAASPEIRALGLDYVLGSVHYVGRPQAGEWWGVDGEPDEAADGVVTTFEGDGRRMAEVYYERMAEMARVAPPDIVGHFDLVKLNNTGDRFFREDDAWYRAAAGRALDAVAEAGCVLEVNTGSMVRRGTPFLYPSDWILDGCRHRNIRVTVNADAHAPGDIDGHFDTAFDRLRRAGIREVWFLARAGWQREPLP